MSHQYSPLQQIKRSFFALRNGALGEIMRRQGADYKIIFGLNIPQLVEIAKQTPKNAHLAQELWDNKTTRESQLLAPMIFPQERFTIEIARRWADSISTTEVADILCHKLLKHMDYAIAFANELMTSDRSISRYLALRLLFNLLPSNIEQTGKYATEEALKNNIITRHLCQSIISEISFIIEGQ